MSVSLEDQRRTLLEQIEASRAVYRRMLAGDSRLDPARRPLPVRAALAAGANGAAGGVGMAAAGSSTQPGYGEAVGGRSKAMQWAMEHPLWVAGGVALLVLLSPRIVDAGKRRARAQPGGKPAQAVPVAPGAGAWRALLAAALLLMRDPARLQAAGRLASTGWRWLQRWRGHGAASSPPPSRWLH